MSTPLPPYKQTQRVGECEIYEEVRDVLENIRKIDECDMQEFGTLDI